MYNESARLAFLANQISTLLNEIRSAARPGARPPRPGGKRQAHTSDVAGDTQGGWFNIETLFCVKYQVLRHQNRC